MIAAIGGFEKAAIGPAERAVFPWPLLSLPQHRVNRLRVVRVKREIDATSEVVLVQHGLKGCSAVGRPVDTALGVWSVGMPQHRHKQPVGVTWIHKNRRDLLPIAKPEM